MSEPGEAAAPLAFAYSRNLAPPMWAFACIMAVELVVVHLLVRIWSPAAAVIFSTLSLALLAWTIMLIRSFARRPVLVGGGEVVMRLGSLREIRVPAGEVAGVRTSWPGGAQKRAGVLNLALINYPNVMLDLDPPLRSRRRTINAVAHRLDDAGAFAAAVALLVEGNAGG